MEIHLHVALRRLCVPTPCTLYFLLTGNFVEMRRESCFKLWALGVGRGEGQWGVDRGCSVDAVDMESG